MEYLENVATPFHDFWPKTLILYPYSSKTLCGKLAVSTFNSTFANHQCTDNDIKQLYNNAKEYKFTTLFVGYESVTNTIALYEEDENGSE